MEQQMDLKYVGDHQKLKPRNIASTMTSVSDRNIPSKHIQLNPYTVSNSAIG